MAKFKEKINQFLININNQIDSKDITSQFNNIQEQQTKNLKKKEFSIHIFI